MSDSALVLENAELLDGVNSSSLKKSRPVTVPPKNLQPPRQPHLCLHLLFLRVSSGHKNHSLNRIPNKKIRETAMEQKLIKNRKTF